VRYCDHTAASVAAPNTGLKMLDTTQPGCKAHGLIDRSCDMVVDKLYENEACL
jgi:hypothetical protein